MVLSNKKLKQKLRAELVESLAASATGLGPKSDRRKNADSQTKSLKELLDSAIHKPRLSKREKRRKALSLKGLVSSNTEENEDREKVDEKENNKESGEKEEVGLVGIGENGENIHEKKKKRKKRKSGEMENGELSGDKDGEGIENEANKSKKRKNKKKKEKKNKAKNEKQKTGGEEQGLTETNEDVDSQVDGIIPTKVYVGGIPYYYTEDDIRSYFKSCGTVTEVECKMRTEDGKFTGIAFLTFETEDAAKRALALDRAAIDERFLTIQPYRKPQAKTESDFAPKMVEGYNRIYIGNLSWDITEDDVRKLFSDCSITFIRFGMDKETGEFRGYAHVDFKDSVSMVMALKLNQALLCGRPVKISCAVPKKGVNTHSRSVPASSGAHLKPEPRSCGANLKPEPTSGETNLKPEPATNGVHLKLEPTSGGTNLKSEPTSGRTNLKPEPTIAGVNGSAAPSSGKIRRRTCYGCGEKGHLSSACPKKQTADTTNSDKT